MTRFAFPFILYPIMLFQIRKPYRIATDDNETITIGVRTLATELTCPICLDLLNVTMTTKVSFSIPHSED